MKRKIEFILIFLISSFFVNGQNKSLYQYEKGKKKFTQTKNKEIDLNNGDDIETYLNTHAGKGSFDPGNLKEVPDPPTYNPDLSSQSYPTEQRGYKVKNRKLKNIDIQKTVDDYSKQTNSKNGNYSDINSSNAEGINKNDDQKQYNSQTNEQVSIAAQQETYYFDAKATNAERYINSPCYLVLGFRPTTDPLLMKEQEERYRQCENEKKMETAKNIAIITCVVTAFFALIYFATRKNKKLKIDTN